MDWIEKLNFENKDSMRGRAVSIRCPECNSSNYRPFYMGETDRAFYECLDCNHEEPPN